MKADSILEGLDQVIQARKAADPQDSYVAQLYSKGLNKILEKVGEEATEAIIAAKDYHADPTKKVEVIGEVADLWFHSMVMLAHLDLNSQDVIDELERRFDLSGLVEKANREV